jgi:hypothetical protein
MRSSCNSHRRVIWLALPLFTFILSRSALWGIAVVDDPEASQKTVRVSAVVGGGSSSSANATHSVDTPPQQLPLRLQEFFLPAEEWIPAPAPVASWQETDKPLCERSQIRQGSWVATELAEGPPYVTSTTHLRCFPKEHFLQRPFPTHKWQPGDKSCDFSKFRVEMMCKLLMDATVMIVGDSLSWEHYSSLVQLAGIRGLHQGMQHQSLELETNIVQHLECAGQKDRVVRLVYRRDDKLLDLPSALSQDFPTVLVLNRGAHYTNDTMLLENLYTNMALLQKLWWKPCQEHGLQCHLFWRTSVPGHPHCGNFSQPVNNRTAMEAWIDDRSHYDAHTIGYHWYDYQRQNLLAEQVWKKANFPVTILDAYDLNVLRPDQHRAHQGDCLHNCYPGKMDVYSQLMMHYLRKDRTVAGVQNQRIGVQDLARSSAGPTKYDKEGWTKARQERAVRKKQRHSSSS